MVNGTTDGPTLEQINDCEETIELNRLAVERLVKIASNVYPQNAYDRTAIYTVRDSL